MRNMKIKNIFVFTTVIALLLISNNLITTQDSEIIADNHYRNGLYYLEMRMFPEAQNYLKQAYELYIKNNNVIRAAEALDKVADACFGQQNYKDFIRKKMKVLDVYFRLNENKYVNEIFKDLTDQAYIVASNSNKIDKKRLEAIREKFSQLKEIQEYFPGLYSLTSSANQIGFVFTVSGYDGIALNVYDKALKLSKDWHYTKDDIPYYNGIVQNILSIMINTGAIYEKNYHYKEALENYQEAITKSFSSNVLGTVLIAMDGVDTIYRNSGNHKTADNHLEYVVNSLSKTNNKYLTAEIIYHFGKKLQNTGQINNDTLLKRYLKALEVLEFGDYKNFKALNSVQKKHITMKILIEIAKLDSKNKHYSQALTKLDTALRIYELFKLHRQAFLINDILENIFHYKAKIYTNMTKYNDAEKEYLKALTFAQKSKDNYKTALYFMEIGKFEAEKLKRYKLAAELYQKAYEYNRLALKEDRNNSFNIETQYRKLMYEKAMLHVLMNDYKSSLAILKDIAGYFVKEKRFYPASKKDQLRHSLGVFKMLPYLYKKLGKGGTSFNYSEYARLMAFQEYGMRNSLFHGASSTKSEKTLTNNLNKVLNLIGKYNTENDITKNKDKYSLAVYSAYDINGEYSPKSTLTELYSYFKKVIENLIKRSKRIKDMFDLNITSAKDVQNHRFIPDDTAVIVYTLNYNYFSRPIVYLIYNNKVRRYSELPRIDYNKLIQEYIKALQDYDSNTYKALSQKLYKYLIEPMETYINEYQNILIIPDGVLNYLPFETLHNGDSFLVEKYNIKYTPSLTVYRQLVRKSKIRKNYALTKKPLFAIGGDIHNNYDYITTKQVSNIHKYMNDYSKQLQSIDTNNISNYLNVLGFTMDSDESGDELINVLSEKFYDTNSAISSASILTGDRATEKYFRDLKRMKTLRDYMIIHISAQAYNIDPFSFIINMKSTGDNDYQDGYFTMSDLYSLSMDTDLFVFNSIIHRYGNIITGESIMNTVYSLINTGASNVILPLWQTQKDISDIFMKSFYNKINKLYKASESISYSNLITETKRNMIENKITQHPYYWSNYICYGSK